MEVALAVAEVAVEGTLAGYLPQYLQVALPEETVNSVLEGVVPSGCLVIAPVAVQRAHKEQEVVNSNLKAVSCLVTLGDLEIHRERGVASSLEVADWTA